MEKAKARREAARKVAALSAAERAEKSRRIIAGLWATPQFAEARVVMLFASMPDEFDTFPLIETAMARGKTVVLPKVLAEGEMAACRVEAAGLTPGAYGILEPAADAAIDVSEIDFCLVPARAFDASGGRLGRGAGYYDRFMCKPGFRAFLCGAAFEEQIIGEVPREPHDVPVQMVVTDVRVIVP